MHSRKFSDLIKAARTAINSALSTVRDNSVNPEVIRSVGVVVDTIQGVLDKQAVQIRRTKKLLHTISDGILVFTVVYQWMQAML